MAKKKKIIKETTIENYYDLKVDKVNELVAALKDETPEDAANDLTMYISDCTGVDDPKTTPARAERSSLTLTKPTFWAKFPFGLKPFLSNGGLRGLSAIS